MAQVLDLGPVCEENITYFARRVKRFHVCDMFLRLNRNKREGLPSKMVWKHLDYRPHSFDGINLWDFIDHLNDDEIAQLASRFEVAVDDKRAVKQQVADLLIEHTKKAK